MIKKVINIFILLLFATQILPIKQVGGLLFGNQIAEDVIQDVDDAAKDGCKIDYKSEFIEQPSCTSLTFIYSMYLFLLDDLSIVFPHNHSTDIYSPPPNC